MGRTWYTVPPPLCLRIKGILARRAARMFTSFQGFWFLPMTTHGSSRYSSSNGTSGDLCRNNLWAVRVKVGLPSFQLADAPVFEREIKIWIR